jgi:hypothetical protein
LNFLITLAYLSVCITSNSLADDDFKIIAPRKRAAQTLVSKAKDIKKTQTTPNIDVLNQIQKQGEKTNELLGKYQNKSGVWDYTMSSILKQERSSEDDY